jgi:hypothetical protein
VALDKGRLVKKVESLSGVMSLDTQEQLAVRAAGQLHVVIAGGAYTSLPLSIPNNTRITVSHLLHDRAPAHRHPCCLLLPVATLDGAVNALSMPDPGLHVSIDRLTWHATSIVKCKQHQTAASLAHHPQQFPGTSICIFWLLSGGERRLAGV